MDAQELRNLQEAYASVYNESMVGGRSLPSPSGGSSRPSLLDRARSTVVDVGGKVGEAEAKRRNPSNIFGIPGRVGRNKGKQAAGNAFDQVKKGNVGGAVKTVFNALNNSVDIFDLVKGYLMSEGATEEEALKIMVTMTDEERLAILESPQPTKKVKKNPDGSMGQQTRNADGSRGPDIKLDRPGDGTKGTRLTVPFSNSAPGAEPGLW